jgi:YidC/Oxa1 family membrane protein insertase
MEKRMIAAIVLSLAIILTFQFLQPKRAQQRPLDEKLSTGTTKEGPALPRENAQAGMPAVSGPESGKEMQTIDYGKEEKKTISTENFYLTFSNIGASLEKITLKATGERDEEVLFEEENPAQRLFAMTSEMMPGLSVKMFDIKQSGDTLECTLKDSGPMGVVKRYTFHKSFNYIELEVSVRNETKQILPFSYSLVGPAALKEAGTVTGRNFLEANAMIDGKKWKVTAAKGTQERAGDISWVALKNRYYTMVLKPLVPPRSVKIKDIADKNLLTEITTRTFNTRPGEQVKEAYIFYAGPLNEKNLAALGFDMQEVVDYGIFGGVSKALLSVLRFFHKGVRNWGLAIILLTIVINVILFPLTMKSFSSMQKMKEIQPHIQKLKELHKDNPQKLNKEMMALYKTYNVNPLGGCLPMLLQMPIFISLYQGLMKSIELKGAHFLWIKDLSKPDAVTLPFSLPAIGNHINILPLLMVGMMVVQQKISQGATGAMTDDQAKQQKMMMIMFPLLFGFMFYKMPSGLVLYWLTNTILMTSEQTLISKRRAGK